MAVNARALNGIGNDERSTYSICTLVTRHDEYRQMIDTFVKAGFHEPDCEYLYVDNSQGNVLDAFQAYNLFLNEARGRYVILCHQDVLLVDDGRTELEAALADLSARDPHWAVCGNAGGYARNMLAIRISDPHGADQRRGDLPVRALALDENFVVVRRDANLALSRDVAGFHLYVADLCIHADILGWSSYVIDFHLKHKSKGKLDRDFTRVQEALVSKYRRAFRSRWIVSPSTEFLLPRDTRYARARLRLADIWTKLRVRLVTRRP